MDEHPDRQLSLVRGTTTRSTPKIIGIYGLPGSGKTFMLNELRQELGNQHFLFFEGSEVISALVPGGLGGFEQLDEQQKTLWRRRALENIRTACTTHGKSGIVTGTFMSWSIEENKEQTVCTVDDMAAYTHVLYLNFPTTVIHWRYEEQRTRPLVMGIHLICWQQAEREQLRLLCRENGILFSVLSNHKSSSSTAATLLRDFHLHTEEYNLSCVKRRLDQILVPREEKLGSTLIVDADMTLAPDDSGSLIWTKLCTSQKWPGDDSPLKSLFTGPLGHSYEAFRQATLLYEEAIDDEEYEILCSEVASKVALYPEFITLLQFVSRQEDIGVVIVSCGLRRVWEKVLEREGFSRTAKVIAGGRISDGFVVTPAVKGAIVARLQQFHRKYVWAFGNSPMDFAMLKEADQAVVVVGDKSPRSKSMDEALSCAIHEDGLQAHQVLLPSDTPPRLDTLTLPVFSERDLVYNILHTRSRLRDSWIQLATNNNVAKILATPMRNSAVGDPSWREAHRRAGAYMATEFVTSIVGVEKYQTSQVQGNHSTGYQLRHEKQTTIVASVPGCEPMASGIKDVFPLATLVHCNGVEDVRRLDVHGQSQVLLVLSVPYDSLSLVHYLQAISKPHPSFRIVFMGVMVSKQLFGSSSAYFNVCDSGDGGSSIVSLRYFDSRGDANFST